MFASCFPVSIQSPSQSSSQGSFEMDLFQEVGQAVFDFASKLASKAQNHNAAPAVLTENQKVQLAKNAGTPTAVLELLSQDSSPFVRSELTFNPSLPMSTLRRLSADSDRFVAGQARAKLSMAA